MRCRYHEERANAEADRGARRRLRVSRARGRPSRGDHVTTASTLILFFNPVSPGWFSCSGTLLDETTFLTAGHCAFDVGTDGAVTPGGSGGNDVWATLDEVVDLSQFPKRADYPDEATLYAARSAWLDANPAFITGTAFPHPAYDDFAEFPNNHDVGVVELDRDSGVEVFGALASLGTLDEATGTGKDHNKVLIETAGYGIQEGPARPAGARRALEVDLCDRQPELAPCGRLERSHLEQPVAGQRSRRILLRRFRRWGVPERHEHGGCGGLVRLQRQLQGRRLLGPRRRHRRPGLHPAIRGRLISGLNP